MARLVLCAAVAVLAWGSNASAATYYVDSTSGSDSNPGTSAQPWRTLNKAIGSTSAGDTAYLRPGSYGARGTQIRIPNGRGGAAGAPITIAGEPGGEKPSVLGGLRIDGDHW